MSFWTLLCVVWMGQTGDVPAIDHELKADKVHAHFSNSVEPVLRVKSGAVVRAETKEATDGQLTPKSDVSAIASLDMGRIHPLTGPIYVEEAEPGDILAVTLHTIELSDWGWVAVVPGLAFLSDQFKEPYLQHFKIDKTAKTADFGDGITIPLKPFPGVMGVAPATSEKLNTIPPRANGGNLDDPHLTAGTTVYFPVFVKGALFSIGDPHAAQGLGEVSGSAIESPLTITFELNLIKGKHKISEPQYETDQFYATTGFATTIDEAARKATAYMVDHLVAVRGLERKRAYLLCSLVGNLHIAETVDVPHMLVTMHIPKSIFNKD